MNMKQILIISRISASKNDNEFNVFFPHQEAPLSVEFNDMKLDIYNGIDFYGKITSIAKRITGKINADAKEVLIIVHFTSGFSDLSPVLNEIREAANWQITQYSGKDENYESEIKPLFQQVIKDRSKVEEIYNFFSVDPILEAKLELFQKIANGETMRKESEENFKLDDKIKDFQVNFDKYIGKGKDFFSVIEDEKAFDDYKQTYDDFYETLRLEN